MLKCDDVLRYLLRAVDEAADLSASERALLDRHTARCADCRQAIDDQRAVSRVLRSRPSDLPSSAFSSSLAARLDRAGSWLLIADWRVWSFRLSPAAALLACAALLWQPVFKPPPQPLTLAQWLTISDTSSPASVLWRRDVAADVVVEVMLTGRVANDGARNGIR
jgi:hypothetical protein